MWFFQFDYAISPFYSDWQIIVSIYFKKQWVQKSIDLFDCHANPSYKKAKIYYLKGKSCFKDKFLVKEWIKTDILKEIWGADPLHI